MNVRRAFQLRLAGLTVDEIANAIDATPEEVDAALDIATRSFEVADREAELVLDLQRVEELHRAVWPAALAKDVNAIREASALMDRRAHLIGELRRHRRSPRV